jgi:predicted metal-binding protein
MNASQKEYVVIVQCDIVKQRCPGYLCEKNFHRRTGGFADYPADKPIRVMMMTCGGCCGRALHRKLSLLKRRLQAQEKIGPERIAVQLSSCITLDNYHAPPCPHKGYLQQLVDKLGLDWAQNTVIDEKSQARRKDGIWQSPRQGACQESPG